MRTTCRLRSYGQGGRKFTGGNTNLSWKIFEIASKEAIHQYSETVKAIADYMGQENTHGGDIRFIIENPNYYHFVRPTYPPPEANQHGRNNLTYIGTEEGFTWIIK